MLPNTDTVITCFVQLPLYILTDVEKQLKALKDGVTFEPLPSFVQRGFHSQLKGVASGNTELPEADLSRVDSKLVSTLMMFQRQGVK